MVISVVDGFIVKLSLVVVSLVDETFSDVNDGVVVLSVEVVFNAVVVVSVTKEYYISRIKDHNGSVILIKCLELMKSHHILRHFFRSQIPHFASLGFATPLL